MNGLAIRTLAVLLALESNILSADICSKCDCKKYPTETSCARCCILSPAAAILEQFLSTSVIPKAQLDAASCVLIFPATKAVGVGIGATNAEGVLVCRTGPKMDGDWGAPAIYKMDSGSLGFQLGGSSTDYIFLIQSRKAADKIISGKLKLGVDASAVAGPLGSEAAGAHHLNADLLTYSRSHGVFAGSSLAGAAIVVDNEANQALYGKSISTASIVRGEAVPSSADPLLNELEKASPRPII